MAVAPVFRTTSGLNNVIEPHRLKYGEDGGCPLAEAVNVVIDDGGGVRRRFGRELLMDAPVHSLWSEGPYCFFVSEGKLYRRLNGSNVLVHNFCGDAPMYFAMLGGKVVASNGTWRSWLYDTTIENYAASIPQQYRSDSRVLGVPASFTRMQTHAGRMYFVDGQFLWESEPFNPRCVDMANGFIDFGSDITDFISVRGGMYVSTAYGLHFLGGSSKADFVLVDAHPSPVVPGTMCRIVGDQVGSGDMVQGVGAVWTAKDGVCVGTEDGKVTNITSRKLVYDNATGGAGAVIPGYYFFSLEVE